MAADELFRAFVVARSQALLSTAYLLTGDWARAEDLLQSALVRSWMAWRRIAGDPEPYVRRVMVNEYASWWRRKWRGEVPTDLLPDANAASDEAVALDARDAMWRLLGRLPRRQRAVIVLRYYEGLSEREIAEVLGCRAGTVKSQAAKAIVRLRAALAAAETAETTERTP